MNNLSYNTAGSGDITVDSIDYTGNIRKFGGTIFYVSDVHGIDTNTGLSPDLAFKTIGASISSLTMGDAISVMAGTYTETGLDLNVQGCEIWFEIGTILAPATGVAMVISASYCHVKGRHNITVVAGEIGVLVTGDFCICEDGKLAGGEVGTCITGTGNTIIECGIGYPSLTAFDIQGHQTKILRCSTAGTANSTGYKVNSNADTGVIENCTSVGHAVNSFIIEAGSIDWTINNCSSGAGDGPRKDVDNTNVWSNFTYPETKFKQIILNNTHNYNLFKVTGTVEIEEIFGHVTTQLVGANSDVYWQLYSATAQDTITKVADADMGPAVIGSVIMKTEDPDKKATFFDGAGVGVDKGIDPKRKTVTINAHNDEDTYIKWICGGNNDTSGTLHFHIVWKALTDDGFISEA